MISSSFPYPDMRGKEIVRYYSLLNPWMDVVIIVNKEDKDLVEQLVDTAMDEFWNSDGNAYGDLIEAYLDNSNIQHQSVYYDERYDDVEYEELWEKFIAALYEAKTV